MKIGVSQMNFKIGALASNADKIIASARALAAKGCDLAVFPELAITGYYPWDLLDQPGFVQEQLRELDRVRRETADLPMALAVGAVTFNEGPGKPLRNSFALFEAGRQIVLGHKQLLPTYNIFDERRHFEPGTETAVATVAGRRLAFLICEDAWNDGRDDYAANPVQAAKAAGVEAIVSLNASPWQTGKHHARAELFAQISNAHGLPILYVNQVGGHDEIVYDGASFAVAPGVGATWKGGFAREEDRVVDFDGATFTGSDSAPWLDSIAGQQLAMIEQGLRDYMAKCGFSKVVVGSSGGIDSALTIAIAERVVGADNVAAITMPSKYSSAGSVDDSAELCARIGVKLDHMSIKPGFDAQMSSFDSTFGRLPARVAIENTQARLRGLILMTYSNDTGALLLTTGNKSEVSVGYCTLYGDMNGGLNLIGDLYKTEVYALARHLNTIDPRRPIPEGIIDKAPSAELFDDQKDSDSLPPYDELDAILRLYLERDLLAPAQVEASWATLRSFGTTDATMEKIMRMVDRAEFKRWQSCPILRMHARAFGTGRRYPIAQGFTPTASMLRSVSAKPLEAKS
jgi:NAD+ synthase (glutamine-hydrolysing)